MHLLKEGREFHHHDEFAKMYVAEIKNLDRILESLVRSGMIPSGFSVPSTAVSELTVSILNLSALAVTSIRMRLRRLNILSDNDCGVLIQALGLLPIPISDL